MSSPSAMPAAARFAGLMPITYRPPFEAMRLRHEWPLMVITTIGRFSCPRASTTSTGTSAPVALPAGTTVARKVLAFNVLFLRSPGDAAHRVDHDDSSGGVRLRHHSLVGRASPAPPNRATGIFDVSSRVAARESAPRRM